MKYRYFLGIVLRLIAAIILLQTLWFKFTGHPESVELFSKLGIEPWGRIFTGIIELIAGLLLLWKPQVLKGAFLSLGLMIGAIAAHVFVIGIESAGDGGQLFLLACVVLLSAVVIIIIYRNNAIKEALIPAFVRRLLLNGKFY